MLPKPFHYAWITVLLVYVYRIGGTINDLVLMLDRFTILHTLLFSTLPILILFKAKKTLTPCLNFEIYEETVLEATERPMRKINYIYISLAIIILPFVFYLYRLAPRSTEWDLGIFTITSQGFTDVFTFIWLAMDHLVLILLFAMVFFLIPRPWHHAWLSFFVINIHRFVGTVNSNYGFVDEAEILYTIPISLVSIIILYVLKAKFKTQLQAINLYKDVESALNMFQNESKKENH